MFFFSFSSKCENLWRNAKKLFEQKRPENQQGTPAGNKESNKKSVKRDRKGERKQQKSVKRDKQGERKKD